MQNKLVLLGTVVEAHLAGTDGRLALEGVLALADLVVGVLDLALYALGDDACFETH